MFANSITGPPPPELVEADELVGARTLFNASLYFLNNKLRFLVAMDLARIQIQTLSLSPTKKKSYRSDKDDNLDSGLAMIDELSRDRTPEIGEFDRTDGESRSPAKLEMSERKIWENCRIFSKEVYYLVLRLCLVE